MGQYTSWRPPADAVLDTYQDLREPYGPVEPPANLPWLGPLPPWIGNDQLKVPPITLKQSILDIAPHPDFNRRNFGQGEPIKRWSPPPDAIPESQFKAQEEPSIFRKAWNALDTPMADIRRRTPEIFAASEEAATPSVFDPDKHTSIARGMNVGTDIISGFSSPLNVGLGLTSGAAISTAELAARNAANPYVANRLLKVANALEAPGRAAGYGMMAGGAVDILDPESDISERLGGAVELGLGRLASRRLTPQAKRTWDIQFGRPPKNYVPPARQMPRFAGEGTPAEYRGNARFYGREDGGIVDREGGFVDLGPQKPRVGESEAIPPPTASGIPYGNEPVSPETPLGTLKPVGRSSTIPKTETQIIRERAEPAGDVPLQEGVNEPESTLRLRIPESPAKAGDITIKRINGRDVVYRGGIPEDQAAERELIQEPQLQHTPEVESLLRQFFKDDTGAMSFEDMRDRFNKIRKGESILESEKKGVAEFETKLDKETRLSLSTKELQHFLSSETIQSEENTRVRTQIENELRRRGVEPKPDYTPISKNIYEGWNWDEKQTSQAEIDRIMAEQSQGKTPQMEVPIKMAYNMPHDSRSLAPTETGQLINNTKLTGNPELDAKITRMKEIVNARQLSVEALQEFRELGSVVSRDPNMPEGWRRQWSQSSSAPTGKLLPIEQGIRTRIPNEIPPSDDEPAKMQASAQPQARTPVDKKIAVREQAISRGINPDQFEHEGDLGQALIDARLQESGAAAKLAEISSKLDFYRKTGDIKQVAQLTDEIGEIRQQAMRENVRELIQKNPDILKEPRIAEIVDAEKMRVPESTNIALGPRIEGGGRLLDALGTALYRRDRAATWVKEGFQNANDERKITKNTEPIRIVFRESVTNPVTGERNKSLIVQDGGRGMNPQQLYTHFSNVGETGKANEVDASGGFGFAKASPFLGGTLMKVTSINKENGRTFRHEFQGTPNQFKNQAVGVPINTVQVANSTKTGFQVEVFYPREQDFYGAKSLINKTVTNTPGMDNIHVLHDQFDDSSSLSQTKKFLEGLPASSAKELKGEPLKTKRASISIPGADVDFHYESDNIERRGGQLYYLNNGTYALDAGFSAGWSSPTLPDIPGSISVNIKSTVEEGKPGYPFTLNREELQSDTEKPIKDWINDNIIEPAKAKKRDELQHLYDTLPVDTTPNGNTFVVLDSGEKYKPEELRRFRGAREVHVVADIYHDIMAALTARFDSTWAEFGETEKLGFIISQPENGGINIPNNRDRLPDGRKKTATMINFLGIATYPTKATPQETAQGIVHAIGHEFAHNKTRPEDQVTWAIYDLFKNWPLEEQMKYAKQIQAAITGPDGRYTPEFEDLLQEYTDARGRPVTKEDILSRQTESFLADERESDGIAEMADSDSPKRKGTIRGESKPRKYGAERTPVKQAARSAATTDKSQPVPLTPETASIRYPVTSIQRLKDALKKGNLLRPIEKQIQGKERSRRAGMIAGVDTPGTKGYFQKLGMLKGPLPNLPIGTELTQGDVDALMTAVNNSTLMPYSKLATQDGLMRLFSGRIPNDSQTRLLAKVFGSDLPELIHLNAGIGMIGNSPMAVVGALVNIPKSLMSGLDLSYTLNQAGPMIFTGEYWKSFANMWQYFGDEKAFTASQDAIFEDPVYQFFQEFERPLFVAGFKKNTEFGELEEQFGSDIATRIPVYKQMGRMQTAFLNQVRFDVAKRLLRDMYKGGVIEWNEQQGSKELAERQARGDVQAMLDMVNNFTGRGNLGRAAVVAPFLNASFFSPSLQMARVHMLMSPYTYMIKPGMQAMGMAGGPEAQQIPPAVRKEAWKSMFAIVSLAAAGVAIANLTGGRVTSDTDDTDWGKGIWGNTRVDFTRGLGGYVVAGSRLLHGRSKSPDRLDAYGNLQKGKEYELGKTFTGPTIRSVVAGFLTNKTSPLGGLLNVWSQGEQGFPPSGIGGMLMPGKQNMTKAAAINMALPMVVNDLIDVYNEDPSVSPRGLSFMLAAILGLPIQTFQSKEPTNPFERGFRTPANPSNQQQYQQPPAGMLVPPQAR